MKNLLLSLFIILTVLSKGQITFNKYYTNGFVTLYPTNVFEQNDSSLVFLNHVKDSATGRQDLNLFRLDKFGNKVQNKVHNLGVDYLMYFNGFKNIIKLSNSSYLTTTATYTGTTTTTLIFTKINAVTLDTIKTRFFCDNVNNYYVNNIIKISANKFYYIGGRGNNSYQSPVIFSLDSNLNIINSFTLSNIMNLTTTNAVLHPITKKLLMAGTITYGVNQVNVGFIEADTLGTVTNTMIIPYSNIQGISQLKYCPFDNTYIFCGNRRTSKVGNTSFIKLQLTKISAINLTVTWSKTYGQSSGNNLMSIYPNTDGSIVSCGVYADSAQFQSQWDAAGVLLKVSSNGDSLWMRRYNNYVNNLNPSSYSETLYGLERTKDGGYIASGGVLNQPKSKAWVIKTDSMGCVSAGCGSLINGTYTATTDVQEFSLANASFKVYPNPVISNLTVELNTPVLDNYELQLVNYLGEVILQTTLQQPKTELDVSYLPKGIYFVKLFKNGEQKVFKVVKA